MSEYWFNTATKQVEEGHQSDWRHLMGPYGTREEAERAIQSAQERTDKWDAEDRADKDWGAGGGPDQGSDPGPEQG